MFPISEFVCAIDTSGRFGFDILYDPGDVSETTREDAELKEGSDDMVSGFGPDVISEFVCAIDISGRFGFDILYDPGGSDSGLSSWGLLVSYVSASEEAHTVVVVVVLRALRYCCEIMSFGALELWRLWTFEYFKNSNCCVSRYCCHCAHAELL